MGRREMPAWIAALILAPSLLLAADAPPTGRMITLRGTVDSGLVQRTMAAVRDAVQAEVSILIFDIQVGQSDFGVCYDLANSISQIAGSVRRTVAFVSKPLTGNGALIALACDEIVMAGSATIGDVTSAGPLKARERTFFESIAVEKGHGKWIAVGLTDRDAQIFEVETVNGKTFKSEAELEEFEKTARVLRKEVVKEAGVDWLIDVPLAKRLGLIRFSRDTRKEVALAYDLPEQTAADDATFKQSVHPMLVRIEGQITPRLMQGILRRLQDAQRRGSTLLFVQIDSTGGDLVAASSLMDVLDRWPGFKVAYVPKEALGPATLLLFGCDEVVVGPGAAIGELVAADDPLSALAEGAVQAAREGKIPEAVVRGMVDREIAVCEVRNKQNPAIRGFRTDAELKDENVAAEWEKVREVKPRGVVWKVTGGEQARSLDLAVAVAEGRDKLLSLYGISEDVPVLQPTWVDGLVDGLTSPGATVFLLVVGMTCLYIEFQMPGFGLGGLLSAICFVLFFWARFLSETANSLEVVMFLLGLILLALELFVFPGFGVAGIAGMLLILASLVLASQSFPWPTSPSETRILMGNVGQLLASLVVFVTLATVIARFFPSLPFFHRLVLPPPMAEIAELGEDIERERLPHEEIIGDVGVAASPLRPAGRMKMGDRFYDVVTTGEFVDSGRPVEVVEVFANRIVVRSVPSSS